MASEDTILVYTGNASITRGRGPKEIDVKVLADNVKQFLSQIETVLVGAPEDVGGFKFTEFTVSAEVEATGKLTLFGTGVEAKALGGLTFKFERK